MKTKLLIICLFISLSALARKDKTDSRFFKGKEPLPSFVYNNCDLTFGVSDPAMNSVTARKQAVTRALFLHALKDNVGVKMITDLYSKNTELSNSYDLRREKCMTLANVNVPPVTYHYSIIDESVNDRGETYVCVQVSEDADSCVTLAANCDFMASHDFDSFDCSEYKVLMTVSVESENVRDTMDYSFKGTFDNPIVSSKFSDHDKFYYRQAYWYYDEGTSVPDTRTYTLKNALWCALVESLCDNVVAMITDDSYIRNINESYNDINQNMSRELVKCKVSCVPVFKGIKDNNLFIDWNIRKCN